MFYGDKLIVFWIINYKETIDTTKMYFLDKGINIKVC